MAYEFQAYPAWRYHADGRTVIVNTPDESRALGEGWSGRPPSSEAVDTRAPETEDERIDLAPEGEAPKPSKKAKAVAS